MKKFLLAAAFALSAITMPTAAHAQQAGANNTVIQETATDPRASSLVQTATGSAQQTLTLTCPSSQYVYLVSYEESEHATTAPAASFLTTTTTGLNGKKWYNFIAAAIGPSSFRINYQPSKALKATTNVVTIVTNAAITNVVYDVSADAFCAY